MYSESIVGLVNSKNKSIKANSEFDAPPDPADYTRMNSILTRHGRKLSYSLDDYTLTIFEKQSVFKNSFPLVLRLSYTTRVNTRSLHWRQDTAGNPCVYTPAASINNRGLFPSQVQYLFSKIFRLSGINQNKQYRTLHKYLKTN